VPPSSFLGTDQASHSERDLAITIAAMVATVIEGIADNSALRGIGRITDAPPIEGR